MSKLTVSRLRLFTILVIITCLIGVFDSYVGDLDRGVDRATSMYNGGVLWLIGGVFVWGFEVLYIPSRYGAGIRQFHFLTAIAFKSAFLVIIIFFSALLSRAYFQDVLNLDFLTEFAFYRSIAFSFAVIFIMQTATQTIRIIGGRTYINFVLGRYRHPIREDKIFMFLDLVGSTALAEKMGDVGVQKMITTFFFDITEPILEHGGEVHRYVGDQVVVTWPLRAGAANMRSIRCCFAIADLIVEKAADYEQEFGSVPGYRIGLHGGPVVISQCGDQKQEISYFGDTVNTAARIEQQCKALDCSLLISSELLNRITLAPEYVSRRMGSVQLRGRENQTELLTIERRDI